MAKYNALFHAAMDTNLPSEARTMRLEQMRGIAYAKDLLDALITQAEENIDYEEQLETEGY